MIKIHLEKKIETFLKGIDDEFDKILKSCVGVEEFLQIALKDEPQVQYPQEENKETPLKDI